MTDDALDEENNGVGSSAGIRRKNGLFTIAGALSRNINGSGGRSSISSSHRRRNCHASPNVSNGLGVRTRHSGRGSRVVLVVPIVVVALAGGDRRRSQSWKRQRPRRRYG